LLRASMIFVVNSVNMESDWDALMWCSISESNDMVGEVREGKY